jgi:hypothetical protein
MKARHLLLSGVLVFGGAFALVLAQTGQPDRGVPGDTVRPAPPTKTTLRIPGTIAKYDQSTRILSLTTANGPQQFQLAPTTRVRQGWRNLDAQELEKLTGYHAAIRYAESDVNRIVESVHIFRKSERAE